MTKAQMQIEIDELQIKIRRLNREVDFIFNELVELSQGWGVRPSFMTTSHSWEIAIKHKAALAVKRVLEMRSL